MYLNVSHVAKNGLHIKISIKCIDVQACKCLTSLCRHITFLCATVTSVLLSLWYIFAHNCSLDLANFASNLDQFGDSGHSVGSFYFIWLIWEMLGRYNYIEDLSTQTPRLKKTEAYLACVFSHPTEHFHCKTHPYICIQMD